MAINWFLIMNIASQNVTDIDRMFMGGGGVSVIPALLLITVVWFFGFKAVARYMERKEMVDLSWKKWVASVTMMSVLSVPLYATQTTKFIRNVKCQSTLQLKEKIEVRDKYPYGASSEPMSYMEYNLIQSDYGLPKLPVEADSIRFSYLYDGFLPDHSIVVEYVVPYGCQLDVYEQDDGNHYQRQQVDEFPKYKRVRYEEGLY
ncbi:MAG: hypothetical protein JJ975_00425 [Bacteroidia bacterium]|nr:hypothetical protein [Bacteroidia bacterium]